jgi:hypothetical protein
MSRPNDARRKYYRAPVSIPTPAVGPQKKSVSALVGCNQQPLLLPPLFGTLTKPAALASYLKMENDSTSAAQALAAIIDLLSRLDDEARARVLKSVSTFFHIPAENEYSIPRPRAEVPQPSSPQRPNFSEGHEPTPKQFLLEKAPQTDVERIACLAYYLTHYRNTPHFTTLELAKLNTEAAQPKFSNTAYAATNAANAGYLASATKTQRQLSAAGEQFVITLPDRAAAKAIMARVRRRSSPPRRK